MSEREKQALISALRLLAATPKSGKQLHEKLVEKGFDLEEVARVVERLESQGILNDRALAQSVMNSLLNRRPSGRRRIAFEMERKGIGKSLICETLQRYTSQEEREKALELARDKRERWQRLDRVKRRKRIYDLLLRRGFDYSLAREVVDQVETQAC